MAQTDGDREPRRSRRAQHAIEALAAVNEAFVIPSPSAENIRRIDEFPVIILTRCLSLFRSIRILVDTGRPDDAMILARSLFEDSVLLGEFSRRPVRERDRLLFRWLIDSYRRFLKVAALAAEGGDEDRPTEVRKKITAAIADYEAQYKRTYPGQKLPSLPETVTAARRQGRVVDLSNYEYGHLFTHGSYAAVVLRRDERPDGTVLVHEASWDPDRLEAVAHFAGRSAIFAHAHAAWADLGLDADGAPTGTRATGFFGRTPIAEIGPAEMKAYGAHLAASGLARSSVRRTLAPLKALLATAHEDGLIRFNPAAGLRNLAPARADEEATAKVKAFTPEELALVLQCVPQAWQPFFAFLAETGLRIGEAIEVRWLDLDRAKGLLTVERQFHRGEVVLPKGRKPRRIPMSKRLDAMLWELRKLTRAADADLIFTAERGARLDQKNLAARVLKPACVKADVGDWPSFHTFRHTAATMLFRTGWNAAQVSRFLGHADAGFTLRTYVHLLDEDLPEPLVLDNIALQLGRESANDQAVAGRWATTQLVGH